MRYNSIKNITMTSKSSLPIFTIGFGIMTSMVLISSLLLLYGTASWGNDVYVFATSQQQQQQQQQQQGKNIIEIAAGGGNYSAPFTMYLPEKVEVNVGQTVNWYNPTDVGE